VVCEGRVIGRGCNLVTQSLDPTAHAEILAIRKACRTLGRFDLRGCALYVSCEPCPMCLAAIYWARLERIFYGATRFDAAQAGFDDSFIYEQIPLELSARAIPMQQTCADAAQSLFQEWAARPDKVPY
jgi:tRNA(Arg) A34 adenosine deaminase TadA